MCDPTPGIWLGSITLRIMRRLRKLRAISEDKAVVLNELELSKRELETLDFLVKKGKIKKTPDDRYYIP